jgi:hypothetical protein
MIQYRIANSIKKLETIDDSLRFFESAKKQEEECLSNLISTYMQQCTAEENQDGIDSLVRYLPTSQKLQESTTEQSQKEQGI